MKTFSINDRVYTAIEFDFNTVCDLEDMGIDLSGIFTKRFSVIRAYFGLCAGMDSKTAGDELAAHMVKGGDLSQLVDAMTEAVQNSDFFRTIGERAEKEARKGKGKKTEEK